ncbi:MAG TPA: NAD-glutamate dehydrogenase domain-containing protein, partial [Candidatus Nitrosotenuis sp.]|nr:NAD-glutamate dehydrogenase domain-containing protein [Candidatus Nitrosotenuis sp.]
YAGAFSEAYKAINPASVAASDIENLEALGDRPFRVDLLNPPEERFGTPATRLKLYHRRPDLVLSDVMPIFENLGLRVVGQTSYAVGSWGQPPQEGLALPAMIDVFRVQDRRGHPLDLKGLRANLMEAVLALLEGTAENDRLNELVLTAGLTCRQVALLRTLQMHFTQLHPGTSRRFVTDTLLAHPDCSRALFACFAARFGQGSWEETSRRYQELLAAVSSLAYDRVLRGLYELVAATVRTNYFLGKPYISCKVNSRQLEGIPEPRPLFEIAVSGPGVEGIHLRGGKVARGGIRWSDRPDDFRTEVLGLMKTQMTKNAVIVPVGAKGGFVLKKAPRAREALQQYAVEQYKIFIRGLLDLTDNIREGQVVAPAGLVIHDEPDPYLVVAADKGTATFSDVANSVAAEYDFWLGDAFASGGSHGYDHKKEGITARGAWECVRRHFREMGIVVGRDLITVAGIGDMSGDVFGNGLLYTDRLKLVAAFNHQHIFLDPDPDPLASYRERQRLFALPRSTWEDYDRSLISPGGGVYPRSAKAIPLAPPVRQMLGVEAEELSGEEVISAILRMPVDLLWNGGIGCYVKASSERHADVGDSANDAVRVNANEVRARVVGEGGNNGFTQLARIEYARLGGRINTDFIDNSAGVDMSDHEVNIKILLGPLVAAGELTSVQRNRLLEEMTDEVSQLVLRDNYRQSMSISLAWRRSRQEPALYAGLLGYLCEHGGLSRRVEFLPDDRALAERERSGEGLSRPELAILLAYTKAVLKRLLLQTDLPEEPCFQGYLTEYFPRVLGQRFPQAIARHQLRREIIATQFTNTAVDLLGMAFVHRTIRVTGASPVQVTRAALTALEILEARRLLEHLFDLDETVGAEEQYRALDLWARAVQQVTTWMLFTRANLASISEVIDTYRQPLGDFRQAMPALLPEAGQARFRAAVEEARGAGFPEEVARDLATLDYLPGAVLIVDVARLAGLPLERAAAHYYAIGERLGLSWLRARLAALPARDRWEPVAIESLITELKQLQSRMTLAALREGALRPEDFLDRHAALFERYDRTRAEMQAQEQLTLAAGDVLARQLLQVARALEDAAGEGPGWSPGRRPPGGGGGGAPAPAGG